MIASAICRHCVIVLLRFIQLLSVWTLTAKNLKRRRADFVLFACACRGCFRCPCGYEKRNMTMRWFKEVLVCCDRSVETFLLLLCFWNQIFEMVKLDLTETRIAELGFPAGFAIILCCNWSPKHCCSRKKKKEGRWAEHLLFWTRLCGRHRCRELDLYLCR